jgi:hypothetical protein
MSSLNWNDCLSPKLRERRTALPSKLRRAPRLAVERRASPAKRRSAKQDGGQGGIRTHDTRKGTPHFECGAINHSTTCPYPEIHHFPGEINGAICEQTAASDKIAPCPGLSARFYMPDVGFDKSG